MFHFSSAAAVKITFINCSIHDLYVIEQHLSQDNNFLKLKYYCCMILIIYTHKNNKCFYSKGRRNIKKCI